MHRNNVLAKEYLSQTDIFADAFNIAVFHDDHFVCPEELVELDPSELFVSEFEKDLEMDELDRDLLKAYVYKKGTSEETHLILGIESQSYKDLYMPIRNYCYDAVRYHQQVQEKIRQRELARQDGKPVSHLVAPVITLVIYLGQDKWTAPRSLHELLDVNDKKILEVVQDYKLNIIDPHSMEDEEIGQYKTSLAAVLYAAKYSRNPVKLLDCLKNNERMRNIPKNAWPLMREVGKLDRYGVDLESIEEKENVNMENDEETMENEEETIDAYEWLNISSVRNMRLI